MELYFQFNPGKNTISLWSDRSQRNGGELQPFESVKGIAFEAFEKARSGKIKPCPEKGYVIKPAQKVTLEVVR